MTQQYRLCDRVRHTVHGEGVITALYFDGPDLEIEVLFLDDSFGAFPAHEFQPVPHPDTVRLDWLEKNQVILIHNIAEDIKHGCAPIEVRCLHEEKPHGGCTAREAIDTAMRKKAA